MLLVRGKAGLDNGTAEIMDRVGDLPSSCVLEEEVAGASANAIDDGTGDDDDDSEVALAHIGGGFITGEIVATNAGGAVATVAIGFDSLDDNGDDGDAFWDVEVVFGFTSPDDSVARAAIVFVS